MLHALSKISVMPIRYSSLPSDNSSLYVKDASVEEIVNILMQPYPEYEVRNSGTHISIVNIRNSSQVSARAFIQSSEEGLSVSGKNIVVSELLRELFSREDKEVLMFNQNNLIIQELRINNRNFEDLLELITDITGLYYREHKGVFAFFQGAPQPMPAVLQYWPSHYTPKQLADLIPAALRVDCSIQTAGYSQNMILIGENENCNELLQTLQQLDSTEDIAVHLFELSYVTAEELLSLLPPKFGGRIRSAEEQRGMYYGLMSTDEFQELQAVLKRIDVPMKTRIHHLQYLSTKEVIANLPSGFPSWRIQESSDPRTLYVTGDAGFYEEFRRLIDPIDKPPVQTQYHILIIQYQHNNTSNYAAELGIAPLNKDSTEGAGANLSQALNLNFDIISAFGYGFAADLSFDIASSRALILVDNLLRGESGKPTHFENTSTYRYREVTENNSLGIVRELTTGLIIDITGRVDHADLVYMNVSIQLSKQGVNVLNRGTLPPSTARIVETSVNTASGIPVRIAGLVLEENSAYSNGIFPLGGTGNSREVSEFVIYILPFAVSTDDGRNYLPDPETMFRELVHEQ